MKRQFHQAAMALIFLASLGAANCSRLPFGFTNVGEITGNVGRYSGKEVKVKGTVSDVLKLPLIESRFYVVKDETGEITVITTSAVPAVGETVKVRGTVDTVATFGGTNIGIHIKEIQRW